MRVRSGRKVATRTERVLHALTAAGALAPAQTPVIDLPMQGLAARAFYDAVLAEGYTEVGGAGWPSDGALSDSGKVLHREGLDEGVYRLADGTVTWIQLRHGWFNIRVASRDRALVNFTLGTFQAAYPPLYLSREDEGVVVPVTFWLLGQYGPERRLRRVDAANWTDVARNYTAEVQAELARLTGPDFRPGADGQLLLWYGPPGTGKTWAIRALASAWAPWAELHYITDPDAFFVKSAAYMVDVLLHESYEMIDEPSGDLVTVTDEGEKWRVLVLEDTGDLLSADAGERATQGLSRLLNVVDGMIGQGLRVLVLVTTNDEVTALHPAVLRPGRCASNVVFGPLSAAEATEWAGEPIDEPQTLAELYARSDGSEEAFAGSDPSEEEAFIAGVIEAVAQPIAAGLNADLSLPPGLRVEYRVEDLDPLTRAAVEAASAPLPELLEDAPSVPVRELELGLAGAHADPALQFALSAVAESHQTSVAAIVDLLAGRRETVQREDDQRVTLEALDVIRELAARPTPVAPDVHVHVPEQPPVNVHVDGAHVEPHIHVPAQEPARVAIGPTHVHVAAAEPAPVQVDVHVPAAPPQPAPIVNVTAAAAPPAPQPERLVRIVEDPETGDRQFVVENLPPPDDE